MEEGRPYNSDDIREELLNEEGAFGTVFQLLDHTGFPLGVKKIPKAATAIPMLQSEFDFLNTPREPIIANFTDYAIHWFGRPIRVVTSYVRLLPNALEPGNREKGVIFEDFAHGEPVIRDYLLNETLPFCFQVAGIMGEIDQLARLSDEGLTLDTHMDEIRVSALETQPIVLGLRFDCMPLQIDDTVPCPVTQVWPGGRRTMQEENLDQVTEALGSAFGNAKQDAGKSIFSATRRMFKRGEIRTFHTLFNTLKDQIGQTPSNQIWDDLVRIKALGMTEWMEIYLKF